jgi:hypothetical protein
MLRHDSAVILRGACGAEKMKTDLFQLLALERRHQKSSSFFLLVPYRLNYGLINNSG